MYDRISGLKLMIQRDGQEKLTTLATINPDSLSGGIEKAVKFLKDQRDRWFFNGPIEYSRAKYFIGHHNYKGEFIPYNPKSGTV